MDEDIASMLAVAIILLSIISIFIVYSIELHIQTMKLIETEEGQCMHSCNVAYGHTGLTECLKMCINGGE